MGFYTRKPLEVEAHRFDGATTNIGQMKKWMETGVWKDAEIHTRDLRSMDVDGVQVVPGDYIVKIGGSFQVLASDVFHAQYEAINNEGRTPGATVASAIRSGDVIAYCGKTYVIGQVRQSGDDTEFVLDDGTRMSVRSSATLDVVKVG